ncbi:MAG TPA: acyltransferase [Candidatus Paceibacterota bacterium]|nr:acyltransferase [Candidatus Paceibacterota bacterium]
MSLAELLTPEVHSPLRWLLKSRLLRFLGVKIGNNVAVDRGFEWLHSGKLTLHDHAVIGRNVKIYNFSEVSIGRFSMFASEILIANGGHDKDNFKPFSGPLAIGNGCWIGAGVRIIGAGSLVISDVPAGAIVAGVPAKVIGYRNLPEKVWHLGDTWFSPHTFESVENK